MDQGSTQIQPPPPAQVARPMQTATGASRWHIRFRQDIRTLQSNHARGVKALSEKAKVGVTTVRLYVDRTFRHFRKRNGWNAYRTWAKHNPSAQQTPVVGQSLKSAYRTLTSANFQTIEKWNNEYLDARPGKATQKEFNEACRDMVDRVRHLQLRYGISVAAMTSHLQDGITPFVALSSQSQKALGAAISGIKAEKTADDLTTFCHAVKLKVWEQPGRQVPTSKTVVTLILPPAQQLAKDLIQHIQSVVGPALELRGESDSTKKWNAATAKGTRLRYKDFFSLLAEVKFSCRDGRLGRTV
ncbi:unnamed protein product [Tilletia laevis]|uniref:Uncharacterized protein n=2 Tax=Tilletia TaxID=13289 RepID=A0A177U125_9BASI|nr:hypothetical protein CF336_g7453 [Tilletia laevis]KAE8245890.1 hypothetical protein A4X03_0g7388 [Tilletia caries]KAE8186231.1 hypothetical protein CF335_g7503 [Tilletia laevis]CAD6885555.1 unnamed protein product [Tilletia caries]CAD6903334.1 unnamed protein product [Tilletia caries]